MIYIVNPSYRFLKDKNRVILHSVDRINDNHSEISFWGIIHPLHAQMFSYFNGESNLENVLFEISKHFNLSYDYIKALIHQFINNPKRVNITYKGQTITFPRFFLIEKKQNIEHIKYNTSDFNFSGNVDLFEMRLSVPHSIMLILTMNCYTNCQYCYAKKNLKTTNALTTKRIIDLIHEASEIGVSNFDLNGGEIILHKDCYEIIREMISCGYDPYISTKVPLNKKQIDHLIEIGIKNIQISIDSLETNYVKDILHVESNYIQLITEMLHLLESKKINVIVNTIINKNNSDINQINQLVVFLTKYKNIVEINFTNATYSIYKPAENFERIKTSMSFLNLLSTRIEEFKKEYPSIHFYYSFSNLYNEFRNPSAFKKRGFCSGNINSLVILPDGKVTICEELYDNPNFIIGDASTDSITDIWNSKKANDLHTLKCTDYFKNTICEKCDDYAICRQRHKVCWREVIAAYGEEKWNYPSPLCPKSPTLINDIYIK